MTKIHFDLLNLYLSHSRLKNLNGKSYSSLIISSKHSKKYISIYSFWLIKTFVNNSRISFLFIHLLYKKYDNFFTINVSYYIDNNDEVKLHLYFY